jgi:hypothetical protein
MLQNIEQGTGKVQVQEGKFHLLRQSATQQQYSNAQVDDYRAAFLYQAPLKMRLSARFSHPTHELKGTAGFGFWNVPFTPGNRRLRFPKTAWFFFGSPPLNIALAKDVSGHGWKAATMDATHWPFFVLLPTAPLGFLLMRVPFLYRLLWPIGQRAVKVSEASLNHVDIIQWHTYQIDWLREKVIFSVDEQVVHTSPYSPTGKMGFVAWIDNQYAIVTPQGRFGWGLIEESSPQWLEIQDISIQQNP